MVTTEIISSVIGLIIGLLTGFYFESRATKSAEQQNKALRHELEILRATVYSLGGDPDVKAPIPSTLDLLEEVRTRALDTQDASGRVGCRELIAHFIERGFNVHDVEAAIAKLRVAGFAEEDGRWLRIR